MKRFYILLFLTLVIWTASWAQPTNDECSNAIVITDPTNFCSKTTGNTVFTNIAATPSGLGAPNCFSSSGKDVWFKFTPLATDVTIVIKGKLNNSSSLTLSQPEAALYYAPNCNSTFSELECQSNTTSSNIVNLYQAGMIVGATYWIRVQGRNNKTGTFQLCITNYNPPKKPGSDCSSASILCDKSTFVVQSVVGAGNDPTEADDATCFSNGAPSSNVEMNSTWFKWTCEKSGPLSFTLTPLKEDDDLDFVVYELPNGLDNCSGKKILRCMASGENFYPSPCMGPTGLRESSTDVSEDAGCATPGKDNFVKALDMVAGKSYALMVNNFTSTGTGFSTEFGQTGGTFVGPKAEFKMDKNPICIGDQITFTDVSTFPLGKIVKWSWSFGEDSNPDVKIGQGPFTVGYDAAGVKSVVLTVETEKGCIITKVQNNVKVDTCCDTKNKINVAAVVNNMKCADIIDGAINLTTSGTFLPHQFKWTNQAITKDIIGISAGTYKVTITNGAKCDTVLTFKITAPTPIVLDTVLKRPTCGGGTDGAITIVPKGGVGPYTYKFPGSSNFISDNKLSNLSAGSYSVTVKDANGCLRIITVNLKELDLILNPTVKIVTEPKCFGSADGEINVTIANGIPPFQYNFGTGFQNDKILAQIKAGKYDVKVKDNNGCIGNFLFDVVEPPKVEVAADTNNITCFGAKDGYSTAKGGGGVGNYSFAWSNGQKNVRVSDLAAGTYTVTATDGNGCTASTSIVITQPAQIDVKVVKVKDVICNGDKTGSLSVIGIGGYAPYKYSIDGIVFKSDTAFKDLAAGTYNITVKDSTACETTINVTIKQPAALIVDAGPDIDVELGYPTTLNAVVSPAGKKIDYIWTPNNGLSCKNCPTPAADSLGNTTQFVVKVTDESGCMATDKVIVHVFKKRPIYIPNAISPDDSGKNDYCNVYAGPDAVNVKLMRIYDRWGELLYEGKDLAVNTSNAGWDGNFRGKPMPSGVYTYYVQVLFIDGEVIPYRGDVTILR